MDLMMDKRPTVMVLGAACSDVTELLAELSAYRNLAQVSQNYNEGRTNYYKY
jgi:Tfp pilus assembly ATPase PilU